MRDEIRLHNSRSLSNPMKNITLAALVVGFALGYVMLGSIDVAADAPPGVQSWEYRIVLEDKWVGELMLKLKREKVYDFKVLEDGSYTADLKGALALAPHWDKYLTERLDGMGADGWQFCGCVDEKPNQRYVFRRSKP